MGTIRQEKVASLLKKDLSEILRREGPRYAPGKMLSVTIVRVSPDLAVAKVYVSVFPSNDPQAEMTQLRSFSSDVRHKLGKLIGKQMRIVPELLFYVDDSLDYADRINKLLDS